MAVFYWIAGMVLGAVWLSRLVDCALGMRYVPDIAQPEWDRRPNPRAPRVSVVVPARNEEEHIEAALRSLLQLDYEDFEVLAVDDRCTDRTGQIMDRIAAEAATNNARQLQVLHVRELPAGWLGKTHAMWTAAQRATGDWILFTDADVVFRPDSLRRAVAYAERARTDHLVLLPTLQMKTPGERMMIAFFQALFVFVHRPWKVANPRKRDHMGVGAFNLVRRGVYEAIGTYQALRMQVIDDMKLGELVKRHGYAQRAVFGRDLLSLRWAHGALGVVRNLTKNFFAVMNFHWWRALGVTAGLAALNLGPLLGLVLAPGWAKSGYGLAAGAIACLYVGMSRRSNISPAYFLLHPVSTLLFAFAILRSAVVTSWHGGVIWRGTKYSLEELRNGVA